MPRQELWGTFAVMDHLRPRAFVAEVLLYDRLIVPRPPTEEEEPPAPGEPDERTLWKRRGWQPEKLDVLLKEELSDLAIPVPWTRELQGNWRARYKDEFGIGPRREAAAWAQNDLENVLAAAATSPDSAGAWVTRGLIKAYADEKADHNLVRQLVALAQPTERDSRIETVIAYGARKNFERDLRLEAAKKGADGGAASLKRGRSSYAIFEWQFFMPEDEDPTERGDRTTLDNALALARRADFREVRQRFQSWLANMHRGQVDPEIARREMERLLKEYRAMLKKQAWRKRVRWASKIAPVVAPLGELVLPGLGVVTGVAAGGAGLYIDKNLPDLQIPDRLTPAAMVHQARRFFAAR
jgi:hypothetical protein